MVCRIHCARHGRLAVPMIVFPLSSCEERTLRITRWVVFVGAVAVILLLFALSPNRDNAHV